MVEHQPHRGEALPGLPETSAAELFALRPRGHRPTVVADANALISDAMRRSRGDFSLMPFLAERGLIRLVTAEHIDEKVYARLPEACRNAHADIGAARDAYETFHRPLLRFVDVGDLMAHDERVGAVAVADEEDAPVAQLGVLLAPAMVLTQDTDLLDAGIGVSEWAKALKQLKELIELDQMMWAGAEGVILTGGLTFYGFRGLRRMLFRSELALGFVLASAALGYIYRDQLREAQGRFKERSGPVVEKAAAGMSVAVERWEAADRRVRPTLARPHETESLEAVVARVLLQCDEPVGAAAVHARLPYPWREASEVARVMDVLREQPAFELVRGRGWMLGRVAQTKSLD